MLGATCYHESRCIGLILGVEKKSENVELISLKIDKEFEGLGYGQKLLNFFCSQLQNLGYQSIELYYGSSWENLDRLEHLLVKGGWIDPLFSFAITRLMQKRHLPHLEKT